MAKRTGLPAGQRRTLARLIASPLPVEIYLAGGAAVGHYLGHRTSLDLDLFTEAPDANLTEVRRRLLQALPDAEVVAETDTALRVRTADGPVDVVRYDGSLGQGEGVLSKRGTKGARGADVRVAPHRRAVARLRPPRLCSRGSAPLRAAGGRPTWRLSRWTGSPAAM